MSRVPRFPLLLGLPLSVGLSLLLWTAAPVHGQGIEVQSVTPDDEAGELSVPVGESLTVTVRGRNLHLVEGATVLLGRRAARGVTAELAPVRRGDRAAQTARQVRITAEAEARPGDGYRLQLVAGRGSADVATFAVTPPGEVPARRATPTPVREAPEEAAGKNVEELRAAGYTAGEVASALQEELGWTSTQVVRAMRTAGYGAEEVGAALHSGLNLTAHQTAGALRAGTFGFESKQTAIALRETFGWGAQLTAAALRQAGYTAEETAPALAAVFQISADQVAQAMREAGYTADERP